ncbi:MAG: 3-deoxy-D-manno-octulosonic acid transferase [Fimbriimonadaceae bacterium]|nr:3-deoxy-D-manno-octulosonic acid transferase [Chitinophagales bacterium]
MKGVALGFAVIIGIILFFLLNPRFLYNIIIALYHTAIKISSLWNKKSKLWVGGRRNIFQELANNFSFPDHKKIWIHCASLGEFEQGRPVIEKIRQNYPEHKILLTFFSPSGYEVRKNYDVADHVAYLPIDTKKNARKFIEIIRPDIAIFVKYEFWVHYIETLYKQKIPVLLISAIFTKKMIFFKWYGKLFRNLLRKFTFIFVQEENSFDLLKKIKLTEVEIAHDTRFDRVTAIASAHVENPILKNFAEGFNVMVAGSTWAADEKLLKHAFYHNLVYNNFKLIVAPHNVSKKDIRKASKKFKKYSVLYSQIENVADTTNNSRVLIIDNIGMLSSLYKYADVCYVGGGFKKGIHNILEAAVYGKPIFFGPKYKKAAEAHGLIKAGAAFSVSDADNLLKDMEFLGGFDAVYKGACRNAAKYVSDRCGGSEKVLEKIRIYL